MSSQENLKSLYKIIDNKKLAETQFCRDHNSPSAHFIKNFKYCLECLRDDYREIINNSFLHCDYKFWWVDTYSETNFYRKRSRAIASFVNLFELINENINGISNFNGSFFN